MSAATPFDDAIKDLRISGSVVLHETYAAPWRISVPASPELAKALGTEPTTRIVPFHYVRTGRFVLSGSTDETLQVDESDLAICPSGKSHLMSLGRPNRTVSLADILAGDSPVALGPGSDTELICGVFLLKASAINPILAALPDFLVVSARRSDADPLLATACDLLSLTLHEGAPGRAAFNSARLLEILCAEAIREYAARAPSGWLRALHDPKISAALELIHRDPGRAWTVEKLANAAALSPSRFAARFRETVGETIGAYLSRWRMIVGCRMLEESGDTIDEIAYALGYGSAPAFSRAFKTTVGTSPSQWRRNRNRN